LLDTDGAFVVAAGSLQAVEGRGLLVRLTFEALASGEAQINLSAVGAAGLLVDARGAPFAPESISGVTVTVN
jgi:hypothetical protein